MDLEFQETVEFEKDKARLSSADQVKITAAINRLATLALKDRAAFLEQVERPELPTLRGELDSSLYVLPATSQSRVIFTVDDDPVFSRTLVTLFRVVGPNEVDREARRVANRLYRDFHVSPYSMKI